MLRVLAAWLTLLVVSTPSVDAQPRLTLDWPAIADRLVAQLALRQGERVLIVMHPGIFEELVPHVRYAVMRAGGVDLGAIAVLGEPFPAAWDPTVLQRGTKDAAAALEAMVSSADAAIMFPGATPSHAAYSAVQAVLGKGRGRAVHFHWIEGGSAYQIAGQPLPSRLEIDRVYQRALLDTDYHALADIQGRFERAMRGAMVRVTTPAGTDLRFRIGDRPVTRQDGDASAARASRAVTLIDREVELPAGAVRVAPIEESVEGTIAFPPSQWDARPVEALALRFAGGRVVEISARSGQDAVEAEMGRAGDVARRFREFALGFNPLLAVPERGPWIPYYGYGAGAVRLSLGDNTELGGAVTGGYVRWNFFVDATVTVGETVWVQAGRLVGH